MLGQLVQVATAARLIAPLTNEAPARVKQMLERQAGAPEE
jgi:hypothetical protein